MITKIRFFSIGESDQSAPITVRMFGFAPIPTEQISNLYRGNEKSLRRREMKLRRNQMKLRRNHFVPTWRIKNSHVEIWNSPRGY
ncbi:hypothetical protein Poras_0734 [Porphyromonas asaccharolytica DSM 20707]|uniref:Uncharacterized protein n=1 Tax=Porphyromonas asaccharolytica (strain ATCC 25260 / DSM 20707 / BCRC 10618 / CCUG 7834 / JCM 6326 / LMG 13178 / VPI 4198 / B440) TaxID=879243 RepID=F4KJV6_PORAD|nr:hypothetical protein Poras_0734 [Porphyromonas asaccharolytica DSM 20707]